MNHTIRQQIATGAIFAGISVAAGAFGAHFLRDKLTQHYLEVYETAVRYQLIHSLAILLTGMLGAHIRIPRFIFLLFVSGIILFSGSLYLLIAGSMSDPNPLRMAGAITPLGGLSFIAAWFSLAYYALKKESDPLK